MVSCASATRSTSTDPRQLLRGDRISRGKTTTTPFFLHGELLRTSEAESLRLDRHQGDSIFVQ